MEFVKDCGKVACLINIGSYVLSGIEAISSTWPDVFCLGMASIDSSAPETTSSDNSPTLVRRNLTGLHGVAHHGPGSDSGSSQKSSDSSGCEFQVAVKSGDDRCAAVHIVVHISGSLCLKLTFNQLCTFEMQLRSFC